MKITGATKVIGVFGWPVRHTLSPIFQNAAFCQLGLAYVYIPLEVRPEDLSAAVRAVRIFCFAGVNITVPHKGAIVRYLDEIDDEVQLLGVANTVKNSGGRLTGYTTDGPGFMYSLQKDGTFNPAKKSVFLFGAGGSARAIAGTLARSKIERLIICNRTREHAVSLAEFLKQKLLFSSVEVVPFEQRKDPGIWKGIHLAVNTTSVGMKEGDPELVDEKNLSNCLFVYDIVYNRQTEFIQAAKRLNVPFLDGLSMLLWQGALSFEIWTGRAAPIDVMRKSVEVFRKDEKDPPGDR